MSHSSKVIFVDVPDNEKTLPAPANAVEAPNMSNVFTLILLFVPAMLNNETS